MKIYGIFGYTKDAICEWRIGIDNKADAMRRFFDYGVAALERGQYAIELREAEITQEMYDKAQYTHYKAHAMALDECQCPNTVLYVNFETGDIKQGQLKWWDR